MLNFTSVPLPTLRALRTALKPDRRKTLGQRLVSVVTATTLVGAALIWGLCGPFAPEWLADCSPIIQRLLSLLQGALVPWLIMAVAGLVIAKRIRQADAGERKLQEIANLVPDGVLVTTPDRQVMLANAPAERMFRLRKDDLLGSRVEQLLLEEFWEPYRILCVAQASRRDVCTPSRTLDVVARCRDGTEIPLAVSVTPLRTDEGLHLLQVFRDLSECRRAEEALQQAEAKYHHIVENVSEGILQITPQNHVLTANRAFARLLGYESSEELIRSVNERVSFYADAADPGRIRQLLEERGSLHGFEVQLIRKDETKLWAALSLRLVRDPGGSPLCYEGTVVDVTEQRRSREALREAQRALSSLLSNLPGVAYRRRHDADGTVEFASEGCRALFGYHPTEILGSWKVSYAALIHAEDRGAVQSEIAAAVAAERPFQLVYRIRTADGQQKWVWEQGRGIAAPGGMVLEGFITDITERKRAEEVIRTNEAKYRSLIENLEQSVFLKDSDLHFLASNQRFAQAVGLTEEEVVGKTDFDLYPRPLAEQHRAEDLAVLRQGTRSEVEEQIVADGKPRTFRVVRTPIHDGLRGTHSVLGIMWDVTEQRALAAQLLQAQKMEAVGRLAGGVAHDFNNLLTIINGYSDMALAGFGETDPARSLIEEVRKAGERAVGLTRQMLAFSRQQVVVPRILQVNDVITDTQKMLRRLIGEDIDLRTDLDPALGCIKADRGQLEQVLMNLVVNARDAMPRGGTLRITTRNVDLDDAHVQAHPGARPGRHVLLALTDTGCGMDEGVQARIFEPFFTTKGPGKGTGLGLATVHGIVEQADGHILVESEVGRGTTFQVFLPCVDGQTASGKSSHFPGVTARGTETVLLVEDEHALRALSCRVLKGRGYHVLEAEHGTEALRVAEHSRGPIHLLVTDVVMPQMGGRELADRLAVLHPNLKVLYLSGYTDDAVVRYGVSEARASFLQKPFTPASLAQKVREVLDTE
jgi:PAS domain S-box-containing protein